MKNYRFSSAQLYALLALVLVFCIDLNTAPTFAVGILYILCCLLVYGEEKQTIIGFSVMTSVLILLRMFVMLPDDISQLDHLWLIVVNRSISVLAVLLVAWMALRQKHQFNKVLESSNGISRILGYNDEGVAIPPNTPSDLGHSSLSNSGFTHNVWFAITGMVLIFIADLYISLGIAIGAFYVICFLFIYSESRRTILWFAAVTPLLIIAKVTVFLIFDIPYELPEWSVFANRVISVAVVIFTAILALRHRTMFDRFNAEREHYVQMLEVSNEKLGAINKAVNQSLLSSITDLQGNFIYVNRLFKRTYQYRADELIGKNYCMLNSGHHPDSFFQQMWDTVLSGKTWFGELRNKAKDGSLHWVDTVVVPIKDKDSKVCQLYCMSKVIDDRKKLEEQLIRSNEEMEHFTYVAAHDLRSPIINMGVLSGMLEDVNGVTEEGREYFDKIKQSIQQMELTINKLNEVISTKRNLTETAEEISISDELDYVLHNIEHQIKSSGAVVHRDLSQAPRICLAKVQMHSILQNLITNAIKYRREDVLPVVEIKSWKQNGRICLSVADNGLGIDIDTHRSKIFGLFKRFHQHVEGKGIGLYLVKSIIDNHGGSIEVKSELNKGTTFIMCFDDIVSGKAETGSE